MLATRASSSLLFCFTHGRAMRQAGCLVLIATASLVLRPATSWAADPPAHGFVISEPSAAGWGLWQPANAPHLVLRPHRQPSYAAPPLGHPHGGGTGDSRHHSGALHHRPDHVSRHRAAVPEAATIYRKEVPYSYGYFGAREHRHWTVQRGHQEDRIQWVLR